MRRSVHSELSGLLRNATRRLDLRSPPSSAALVKPATNAKFGEYQSPVAMALFKQNNDRFGSPKAVAEAILDSLSDEFEPTLIDRAEISGPGFINIGLSKSYVSDRINTAFLGQLQPCRSLCAAQARRGASQTGDTRAVVDFSSPNIAKEMHVGHLRSTIIGESICRILEFSGVTTQRINHVGDWGTHFGMLIACLKDEFQDINTALSDNDLKSLEGIGLGKLNSIYKRAKNRFDAEDGFRDRSRAELVALQSHDPVNLALWKLICATSRREFDSIYRVLDVNLEERGESTYNRELPSLVDELVSSGAAQVKDGATVLFVEGSGVDAPLMLRKSDGGHTYDTTDLAALRQRVDDEQADWLIYVTDNGQRAHFDLVFGAAEALGWVSDKRPRLDHVGFGVVRREDGKMFKSREGDTVRLADLLEEAKARCAQSLRERGYEGEVGLDEAAEVLGIGAVKYFDLKQNRNTDYKFSFDSMLDLRGNTNVYVQYTHSRLCSILRKFGDDGDGNATVASQLTPDDLENPTVWALVSHLIRFHEAIDVAAETLAPNRVCEYLYELCVRANQFYRDCPVKGDPARLALCQATVTAMRASCHVIGVRTLSQL